MELLERVKFKNADENSLSIYKDSRGRFWVETEGSGTYALEFISLKDARAYLLSESAQYEHTHEPIGGIETYPYAKIRLHTITKGD